MGKLRRHFARQATVQEWCLSAGSGGKPGRVWSEAETVDRDEGLNEGKDGNEKGCVCWRKRDRLRIRRM